LKHSRKTGTIIEAAEAAASSAAFFIRRTFRLCAYRSSGAAVKTIQGAKIKDFNKSPMWV
jgi:hypothetical protein